MKGSKILITLGMIGVLAGGWGVFWSKNIHSYLEYKNLLAAAEDSLKDGLYEHRNKYNTFPGFLSIQNKL